MMGVEKNRFANAKYFRENEETLMPHNQVLEENGEKFARSIQIVIQRRICRFPRCSYGWEMVDLYRGGGPDEEEGEWIRKSMHHHIIVLVWLILWLLLLLLLIAVRIVTCRRRGDRTSRHSLISLNLVPRNVVISLWRNRRCEITIDHVSIWLLRCRVDVVVLLYLLDRLAGRCWWTGTTADGSLVKKELFESGGNARHGRYGILSGEHLGWSVKFAGKVQEGHVLDMVVTIRGFRATKNTAG